MTVREVLKICTKTVGRKLRTERRVPISNCDIQRSRARSRSPLTVETLQRER